MFVTYAQNFEDVMLWRALGTVGKGFYVDVGAQHPVTDSVSLAFYEKGWRGVHIEPVSAYAKLLREHRPDETVLEIALSNVSGQRNIIEIPDTGLSTFSEDHAARHHRESGYELKTQSVRTMTLDEALADFLGREVHWLKIDVEGAEKEVIEGWNGRAIRPWILVIESTLPNSQDEDHDRWEPIVLSRGYRYCYFDGLNRYYVAEEHGELESAFRAPPNVFDQFVPAALVKSMSECEELQGTCERLRVELSETQRQVVLANERVQEIEKLATDVIAAAQEAEARQVAAKAASDLDATRNPEEGSRHLRLIDLRNSHRLLSDDDFAAMVLQERRLS